MSDLSRVADDGGDCRFIPADAVYAGMAIPLKCVLPVSIIVLASMVTLGCSSTPPSSETGWTGYTEKGKASFYADKHQNQKTACGERYDHALKTAAHRTIPCGETLKVTNVHNGKSVVVEVNDRGPFVDGRIVDLSKSAFSSIGSTSLGLLSVQIEVIE